MVTSSMNTLEDSQACFDLCSSWSNVSILLCLDQNSVSGWCAVKEINKQKEKNNLSISQVLQFMCHALNTMER
jgi:hypothetical protein